MIPQRKRLWLNDLLITGAKHAQQRTEKQRGLSSYFFCLIVTTVLDADPLPCSSHGLHHYETQLDTASRRLWNRNEAMLEGEGGCCLYGFQFTGCFNICPLNLGETPVTETTHGDVDKTEGHTKAGALFKLSQIKPQFWV